MRCVYNRLVLELTGEVFDYREAPRLDLRLKLPEVTLADAIQSLPAGLSRNFGASDFAGSLLGSVHLVGSLSKPETLPVEGEFKLKEVGARVGQLRSRLDGVLRLDKGKVSGQGLKIEVGDNQLLADIRAEHIFAKPVTLATTLRAETLKIDSLLPPGPEGEKGGSEPASGRAGGEGEEPGPFDLPLEMDGQAILGKVLYKDLTVKDVAIDWHLAQNVLRITRMDGKVASGSIKSKASVDLKRKGLAYDADLQASQVEAAPLVVTFFPKASGAVAGNIDLTMSLSGAGVQPENIKQNLRGDGSFAIRNGQLTGDGLMQGLGTYLDLDDLRVFRFDLGKGTFNIRNGALHLDASFTGSKARLFPSGKADFGNSLDLRLKTYLSPENTRKLAGKGTFGELMADEQGWGLIPLMVTGTFSRPKIALDRAAMTEQVKKGTKRKLQDKLEKKILKKIAPSEGEGKEEEPAKKLLEDTLRGLFGD
jgi:AsmA protein